MLNRRGFFGAAAAAAVAGPQVVAEAANPVIAHTFSVTSDMVAGSVPLGMGGGHLRTLKGISASVRPIDFRPDREYVYRTGCPEIDCLKSVSGVYRKKMEERLG